MHHAIKPALTPYEQSALSDADAALSPYRTPISTLVHFTTRQSFVRASEPDPIVQGLWRIFAAMGHVAAKTVGRVRRNDLRGSTLRPMRSAAETARLDLWEIDETVRWLELKYAFCGVLLGVAGGFGVRGLAASEPLVTWLAMRQISEYAVRYGFELHDPDERAFATRIFVSALCPHRLPREADASDLSLVTEAAKRVSRFAGLLDAARGLVRRVLRPRKTRAAPVAVAIGVAVYNVWLMRGVARMAALAYRERFIARKHHVSLAELDALAEFDGRAASEPPPPPSSESPVTSRERSEACPPDPFERRDEAHPASAKFAVGR